MVDSAGHIQSDLTLSDACSTFAPEQAGEAQVLPLVQGRRDACSKEYAATFDVMQEAFPDGKVIGYLYNPAEANSVAQFEETEPIVEELGYTLEIGTISNSSEIKTAAEALVARGIDFFYYSQDSTMASGAEGLIQVANENAIPIITNDMPGVGRGVALGVGLDFSEDGKMSGQYAVEFLNGELDLATAEILRVETTEYHGSSGICSFVIICHSEETRNLSCLQAGDSSFLSE